jgi:hypothetical protein
MAGASRHLGRWQARLQVASTVPAALMRPDAGRIDRRRRRTGRAHFAPHRPPTDSEPRRRSARTAVPSRLVLDQQRVNLPLRRVAPHAQCRHPLRSFVCARHARRRRARQCPRRLRSSRWSTRHHHSRIGGPCYRPLPQCEWRVLDSSQCQWRAVIARLSLKYDAGQLAGLARDERDRRRRNPSENGVARRSAKPTPFIP